MKSNRQTGRTTRMLAEAVTLAKAGRAVYVVVANEREVERIESLLPDNLGIQVETEYSLGNLDWESLRLVGAHPNCVVLVDHYAIESKFRQALAMLQRYDAS